MDPKILRALSSKNSDFNFYTDKYDYIESCIVINTVDGEKEFNIYIKNGSDNIYLTKMHYCLDSQWNLNCDK